MYRIAEEHERDSIENSYKRKYQPSNLNNLYMESKIMKYHDFETSVWPTYKYYSISIQIFNVRQYIKSREKKHVQIIVKFKKSMTWL